MPRSHHWCRNAGVGRQDHIALAGDRVLIGGKAVLYSRGEIEIDDASAGAVNR